MVDVAQALWRVVVITFSNDAEVKALYDRARQVCVDFHRMRQVLLETGLRLQATLAYSRSLRDDFSPHNRYPPSG
jgi:hypothetical protein